MSGKQPISSFVGAVLVLALFSILPTDGQVVCPWCDKKMENDLVNCVYIEMISRPELMRMPLRDVDSIKWKLLSDSDSMVGMTAVAKKVAMDNKFVDAMADAIKQNDYKSNPAIIDVVSQLAGNCYSSVTGYNSNVVIQDIKRLVNEYIGKSSVPERSDTNPAPNSEMPYTVNQNQQSSFQQPQTQPLYGYNAPINPPAPPPPPVNTFNNPSYENNAPFNPPASPPVNSFNNPSYGNDSPFNPRGSPPINSFNNPSYGNDAPFNPPGSPPVNSFNNPSYGNDAPFNPPVSSPINSYNKPFYGNDAPVNPPGSPPMNPSRNPSSNNNDERPSENSQSNNYKRSRPAGSDFSRNQAQSTGTSGTSLQNDNVPQNKRNSPINADFETTASPKSSSPPKSSESSDSNTSDHSNLTTPSPLTNSPEKKTTGSETLEDEKPCDEEFKDALYEKLINDDRFYTFFGKLSLSDTKRGMEDIMKHVFKKYGIQKHYSEFSTFWKFDSKTLNKESKPKDWDEVISKICKVIFSRNNLLKGDCKEIGIEIADYILDMFPGDPPSTQKPNTNVGNDKPTTESPINSSPKNNSTNNGNPSFPELNSKLSNTFNKNGSTSQDTDDVPFSETLSTFEAEQNLKILHQSAESCLSPNGFDFDNFLSTMSDVTDSIQKNHPDWSRDKCEKEMSSATVAVLAQILQDLAQSKSNNAQSDSSNTQPDSTSKSNTAVDSSASQSSNSGAPSDETNSGTSPEKPNDYNSYPDYENSYTDDYSYPDDYYSYSEDPSYPQTDYDSDNDRQPQQDYMDMDYDDDADSSLPATGMNGDTPYENKPSPDYGNAGLRQPSNFASNPVKSNYGNQQYDYGSRDYRPEIPQRNFPSQDYPVIPPDNMNSRPNYGTQPYIQPNQNTGYQQSPNFQPSSGYMKSPNGNNQYPATNFGNDYGYNSRQPANSPVLPNGNSQNFQRQPTQNYDYSGLSNRQAPNGNSQPGFISNYDSGFPGNPQW